MNTKLLQKLGVVVAAIGLIAGFWYFDLSRYLTLSYLKSSRTEFSFLYSRHQYLVIAAYAAIYVLVTSLSLPGAAVLTLAAGAIFGFWVGTLVVSFASTIGATLACLVARFLLRDWVQRRFGDRLATINRGIEEEGSFYLFTLRLIPVFPFFLINLAMGPTGMRLLTYYWVSQVGMLPGTMAYVNAGKQLARIDSPAGVLSPSLIFSFVLIGILPLAAKKSLAFHKSRLKKGEQNPGS